MVEVELASRDDSEGETFTAVHGTAWTAIVHMAQRIFRRRKKESEHSD